MNMTHPFPSGRLVPRWNRGLNRASIPWTLPRLAAGCRAGPDSLVGQEAQEVMEPRRIVVLDDDARVRQLIQSALRPPEFEVFAFADGRDALMQLHEIRADLI